MKKKFVKNEYEISEEVSSYLNKISILLLILDKRAKITMINKRGCDLLGCEQEAILGKDWFGFLPFNARQETRDYFAAMMAEKKDVLKFHENAVIGKNKKERLLSWNNELVKNNKGEVQGMICTGRDITVDRERENELIRKNKINRDILEHSPFGIFIINKDGNVDFVNKAMLNISAANYDRFIGLNFFKHKMYKKIGLDKKIRAGLNGEYFKIESMLYTSTQGNKTTVRNFTGIPLDDQGGKKLMMIVEDVSELVKKEEEIASKGKYLKDIIESIGYPFYSINVKDFTINLANSAALKNSKLKEGLKCFEVTHNRKSPCNSLEHPCPLKTVLRTKKPFIVEHIHFDSNNNPINAEVHAYPLFNEKGEVAEIIETSLDITARKKAFEIVEKHEEMQRDILDNANDLIQSVDMLGNVIYVNQSWKKTLGYTDEEAAAINVYRDVVHPEFYNKCKKDLSAVKKQKNLNNVQVVFKTKKNIKIYLEGNISCRYEKGVPVSTRGIFRDITDKIIHEKELQKRTSELERFNKIAVDRELKMIELKKYIQKIEKELNNQKLHN